LAWLSSLATIHATASGQIFLPGFVATEESWAAAEILVAAPRSMKIFTVTWWFVTGKLRRSKRLLAQMVNEDLSAVNAIGIAVHNVVKGLRQMRTLYADSDVRSSLSSETAARQTVGDFLHQQPAYSVESLAGKIQCPTLITDSEGDFASQSHKLFDLLMCEKKLVRFTEAQGAGGHCCRLGQTLWEEAVFDWLDNLLV
jgi:hypothetical protein